MQTSWLRFPVLCSVARVKTSMTGLLGILGSAVLGLLASTSWAASIGPQGFSSSATVINFDNLPLGTVDDGPSIPSDQYSNLGVTFDNFGRPMRAIGAPLLSWVSNSTPPAVAWANLGGGDPNTANNYLQVTFTEDVYRVGYNFGISADARIELYLYDSEGNELASGITNHNTSGTFAGGFIGLATTEPVATARMKSIRPSNNTGLNFSFDNFLLDSVPGGTGTQAVETNQPVVQLLGSGQAGAAAFNFGSSGEAIGTPGNLQVSYLATTLSMYNPVDHGYSNFNFDLPVTDALQIWEVDFAGEIASGLSVLVTLNYDDTGMSLTQEQNLALRHFTGGAWVQEASIVDVTANTISAHLTSFSPLVLASAVPEPSTIVVVCVGGFLLILQRRAASRPSGLTTRV